MPTGMMFIPRNEATKLPQHHRIGEQPVEGIRPHFLGSCYHQEDLMPIAVISSWLLTFPAAKIYWKWWKVFIPNSEQILYQLFCLGNLLVMFQLACFQSLLSRLHGENSPQLGICFFSAKVTAKTPGIETTQWSKAVGPLQGILWTTLLGHGFWWNLWEKNHGNGMASKYEVDSKVYDINFPELN